MSAWRLVSSSAFAILGVLAASCGGSSPTKVVNTDAETADASDAVLATCRFKCKSDVDCCAPLGLGAGCPTTYPNHAICNLPVGLCEWHFNCEQESECQTAKGDAYSCIFASGSTHGFCRKQCTTADDCAGEATLYDPPGQMCKGGRCYGDGKPAPDGGLPHPVDPPPPAPPCKSDQDCAHSLGNPPVGSSPGGTRCQTSTGRCLACIADSDCAGNPDGPTCNVTKGWCGCRDNASCANSLVCGYQ